MPLHGRNVKPLSPTMQAPSWANFRHKFTGQYWFLLINGLTPWCRRPPFGGPWLSDVMRCYPTCFHICHVCPWFSPVKAHSGVLCPDGPCFAQVLTPSKWSKATWPGAGKGLPLQGNVFAVTWEGSGKAVKAHRGVLCRDGPCFAHVLKPSKWTMATWPGAGKGLPLQGNVFAVTWEGSGKAVKAHRGVLCRDGPCFAHVLKPSKWSMATCHLDGPVNEKGG